MTSGSRPGCRYIPAPLEALALPATVSDVHITATSPQVHYVAPYVLDTGDITRHENEDEDEDVCGLLIDGFGSCKLCKHTRHIVEVPLEPSPTLCEP